MSESSKSKESRRTPETRRSEGQATLSAIGDVSIAATEAISRGSAPRRTRWLPIVGFLLFVFVAGSMAAIYALKSPPWVQAFVAPLLLVVIATLAFWRRQVWKLRARAARFQAKAQENRLNSLAHETANSLNAVRANLAGLREATSPLPADAHQMQVEQALERIEAALTRAIGESPANSRSVRKAESPSQAA